MQLHRRLDNSHGHRRTRAFAKAHPECQQRHFIETFKHLTVVALSRQVARNAMVDGVRIDRVQYGCRSRRHIAVDHHRNMLRSRRNDCARHGSNLAATEAAEHLKRIMQQGFVALDARFNCRDFTGQTFFVHPGATPDPFLRTAAIEGCKNCRRRGGVADAQFANCQHINAASDGFHAESHGPDTGFFVHRRFFGKIFGRLVDGEIKHFEAKTVSGAYLIDRRPTRREVVEHLLVHFRRKGRNAPLHHTMAARKHTNRGPVHGGLFLGLPPRQPFRQPFETPKAALRLGEILIVVARLVRRMFIPSRQSRQNGADIIERRAGNDAGHGGSSINGRQRLPVLYPPDSIQESRLNHIMPAHSSEKAQGSRRLLSPLWAVASCLRFYSRLPIPALPGEIAPYRAPDFDIMPRALPFAGAVIGIIGAMVLAIGVWLAFGAMVSAGLAIAAMTFITGAFHEDGLADTADGFGGGATIERRLAIMKDSLIGSFGASALALAFILRVGALSGITERSTLTASMAALIMAAILSRISALSILIALPAARTDGLSSTVGKTSWSNYGAGLGLAWLLTIIIGFCAGVPTIGLGLALLAPLGVCYLMALMSRRMIGGQTGDVAGAAQQLGEIAVYLAILGAAR